MTTGMKQGPTKETRDSRRKTNWAWAIVAIVVLIILLVIAFNSSHPNRNPNAPSATTGAVQQSGTGTQGSVGHFAEPVVPNPSPNANTNPSNPSLLTPQNAGPGTPAPALPTTSGTTNTSGDDSGAGNTGISTATESVGGATPKGGQGATSTVPSTPQAKGRL